jgi:Fuc2NAc and GlcNAc transferase
MDGSNLILYLICIGLSGTGAWLIGRYGHHLDLLDKPNERSSHSDTTPKGGGIGVLAGFIASAFILKLSGFFWIPAAMLSLVSFIGDRYNLSPAIRLIIQLAASIFFLVGVWITHLYSSVGYILMIPLALYIVGTTNCYNFMDGINGLAAITGIVGFGLVAYYSIYFTTLSSLIPLNICMALCCMGFLPFNMPAAKVFMGDVGSVLLGFVFAVMVVWSSASPTDFLCLASFLFPFYADEITTQLIRLKNGEKLWLPHRKHLYQLLANELKISHWKISLGYGVAQLIIGVSILFVGKSGIFPVLSTLFIYLCVFSVVSFTMRKNLINEI